MSVATFFGRVWPLLLVGSLAGCGMTLAPPGFVHETRHGICRARLDFNSYRRPSFSFERYERLPPESARVKLFRWSHAASIDKPIILPAGHTGIAAAAPPANIPPPVVDVPPPVKEIPQGVAGRLDDDFVPPPAPPSEIKEPRFPPLESAVVPAVEVKLSREIEELPAEPVVALGFSDMEDAELPPNELELAVPIPAEPIRCNVPRRPLWKNLLPGPGGSGE